MKDKLPAATEWLLKRAHERSTWVGLFMLAGALLGHQFDSATVDTVANFAILVSGLLISHREREKC